MNLVQRKRIRRPLTDYRAGGAYFCTICVHRQHRSKDLFGRVEEGALRLNRFGNLVRSCWEDVPNHRDIVTLDAFVVMPNHVHLLFFLDAPIQTENYNARFGPPLANSVGTIVGAFKSAVTRAVSADRGESTSVWQPRFHDRIVRDERELDAVRRYIENNPANWVNDRCHPQHLNFESTWKGGSPDPNEFV